MNEPKENKCEIAFNCNTKLHNECVYFQCKEDDGNHVCDWWVSELDRCYSKVANVNRMILELKEQGIDHENL